MDKDKLEKAKIDNSFTYNYRDEDTLYFVNFKNLVLVDITISYTCTFLFYVFITSVGIDINHMAIGMISTIYLLYISAMILQVFAILNYKFLVKKNLKKFSWPSCIFIIALSIFYIIILNIPLVFGIDFVNKVLA